jgi:hypothetical protein
VGVWWRATSTRRIRALSATSSSAITRWKRPASECGQGSSGRTISLPSFESVQRGLLGQLLQTCARDCVRRPRSCVNGVGGLELVYLIKGTMPRSATTATVITDTDCAADRNGSSHCSNILRLASGRRTTVRHDHSMMNDPCLSPRKRVRVRSLR